MSLTFKEMDYAGSIMSKFPPKEDSFKELKDVTGTRLIWESTITVENLKTSKSFLDSMKVIGCIQESDNTSLQVFVSEGTGRSLRIRVRGDDKVHVTLVFGESKCPSVRCEKKLEVIDWPNSCSLYADVKKNTDKVHFTSDKVVSKFGENTHGLQTGPLDV